ncbi:arginase family protein [Streptomyces sp. NPDC014724]|uniref:arginase family protein n=1 Tax=Streptomyces sp. NPDC014724 TaxID=3364882 RepID=UPI0036FD29D8
MRSTPGCNRGPVGTGPVTLVRDVDPAALSALRGRKVHVSLDVDVFDPVYVPNTGSREPFGALRRAVTGGRRDRVRRLRRGQL